MKEYVCVQVLSHGQIAEAIQEHLADGWRLHTYQATGHESSNSNSHFLLFEREA